MSIRNPLSNAVVTYGLGKMLLKNGEKGFFTQSQFLIIHGIAIAAAHADTMATLREVDTQALGAAWDCAGHGAAPQLFQATNPMAYSTPKQAVYFTA